MKSNVRAFRISAALRVGLAIAMLFNVVSVSAQTFPSRPVRLIVPYTTGIGPDIVARLVAERLSKTWGQPVIIENRPGGSGLIAFGEVKRAVPDGHTLFVGDAGTLAINPRLFAKLPYNVDTDFTPVSTLFRVQFVLFARPDGPIKSLADLAAFGQQNPGKLTYASLGAGHPSQLAMEMLAIRIGIKLTEVPFRDVGQFMGSVVSGQVDLMALGHNTARGFLSAGKLRALAVGAPQRLPALPDVPTIVEAGGPNIDQVMTQWVAIMAPAGVPRAAMARIESDLSETLNSNEIRDRIQALGLEPFPSTPQQLASLIKSDTEHYGTLIKQLGIKAE